MHSQTKIRRLWCLLLLVVVSALVQNLSAQTGSPNLNVLKGEMKVFEAVINETMAQSFAHPFGLLEKAKGTYLPGFGTVFSLEVNLYPVPPPSLFNLNPPSKEEQQKVRKARQERLAIIKQAVPRLLADHARGLRNVSPDEFVAVAVHLFQFPVEDDEFPSQIVWQVKKSDLEKFWEGKLPYVELQEKIKVLEL